MVERLGCPPAEFFDDGLPILTFEATFTEQFADSPVPVPRYDYNQVMYRLDLDDARLRAEKTTAACSKEESHHRQPAI